MTRLLTIALAACLFTAPAFAAPVNAKAPEGAKQGPAHFDHEKHGIKQAGDKNGASCKQCHDAVKDVKAGDMKNAGHGVCLDCHKGEGKAKGAPQACTACHAKKA
jgi:predicted CXXCH cytochrome family protein